MDLKNKIVTAAGIGNSGLNAARLLKSVGAVVKTTDSLDNEATQAAARLLKGEGISVELGAHTEGFFEGSDLIVVSPGIEKDSTAMALARKYKIPVIGEMELGSRFCRGKIIAVTGTNGKSTVTTLIGNLLKDAGKDSVTCGNIGNSLCGEIARINENTWVVLEVSSFQLETVKSFKPAIAVILNITDDHMDRYGSFGEYFEEKLKIFANQDRGDILILNYDAVNLRPLKNKAESKVLFYSRFKKTNGAYVKDGKIYGLADGRALEVCSVSDIRIKGSHNVENVTSAVLAGLIAGAGRETIGNTVRNFKGLPHRVEAVDIVDGVEYIDDSKGTTVDSTYRALETCDKPVILIAGGKDKHSDYSYVRDMVKKKVRALVLIGEAKGAIRKALNGAADIVEAKDMFDAVVISRRLAEKGWIVLLSPMCSSFDMFKDYKERGDAFRKAVEMMHRREPVKS